jgi:hypothetical protein
MRLEAWMDLRKSSQHPTQAGIAGSGSLTSIFLMILAGLPATQWKSGTSFVTTLPAPTVQPLPMVTPGSTILRQDLMSVLSVREVSRALGATQDGKYLP